MPACDRKWATKEQMLSLYDINNTSNGWGTVLTKCSNE